MQFLIVYTDHANCLVGETPCPQVTAIKKTIANLGMVIINESRDFVACEGSWWAGVKLRSVCRSNHWRCSQVGSEGNSALSSFVFLVTALFILLMSLYGTVVLFRCCRDVLGSHTTIGQATTFAAVLWFGLWGLMGISRPR